MVGCQGRPGKNSHSTAVFVVEVALSLLLIFSESHAQGRVQLPSLPQTRPFLTNCVQPIPCTGWVGEKQALSPAPWPVRGFLTVLIFLPRA